LEAWDWPCSDAQSCDALSRQGVLGSRRLELQLPFKDACAGGCCLSLWDVASALQRDGQRCVGEWVGRRDGGEREGGGDGLFELSRVAEGTDESVVGFNLSLDFIWPGGDGSAESFGCLGRLPGGEKIKSALVEQFGGVGVGFGHGCL